MRFAARAGTTTYPRWAIEAGLRPLDPQGSTFVGALSASRARFTVTHVGEVTTLRAAAPAAAGIQAPVYAWWDPVYRELACGARRIEDSDTACAFLSCGLRDALSVPELIREGPQEAAAHVVPVVTWSAGQVIVQWRRPLTDPEQLSALVAALDAAVVAVREAQLDELDDLALHEDLPTCRPPCEDGAPADGALAAVFVSVAALAGGFVLAAGAGVLGALLVAALVVAVGAAVTIPDRAPGRDMRMPDGSELFADLYAGYHGLRREDPAAFQRSCWPLGVACAPVVVLGGIVPGTTYAGRMLWGTGPGGCAAAAVVVPLAAGMIETVASRVDGVDGASLAGACLVVVAAADPPPAGPELVDEVTRRAAALLA